MSARKEKRFQLTFSEKEYNDLQVYAESKGLSMAALIRLLVSQAIKNDKAADELLKGT